MLRTLLLLYGGRQKRETVRVRTNDPARPLLNLVVTGKVDKKPPADALPKPSAR